jgi:cyclophilin family peptidyl-prolyl cis-trans isomerase
VRIRLALVGLGVVTVLTVGGCPFDTPVVEGSQRARFTTSLGDIVVELDADAAPLTVANFEQYVEDGFYDGTVFHRVVAGFVVQGGGFEPGLVEKETRPPIANESFNGLLNKRGTLAMARTADPNSATSQFYFNLVDNPALDASFEQFGYTVFGTVVEGLAVVDQIANVAVTTVNTFENVPEEDVVLISVTLETGPDTLSPEAEAYFQNLRLGSLNLGRNILVDLLGSAISGGG